MDAILAILATPAGQALLSAGVTQAVSVAGGADPLAAQADFAAAVAVYQTSVEAWEKAKADVDAWAKAKS